MIDTRLLDARDQTAVEENFNRILALIDAISGETGTVAALTARVTALDDTDDEESLISRVTALEQEADTTPAGET